MSLYMVSYDLNQPGQDYETVINAIKSLGTWCHYLESTFLVKSNLDLSTFSKSITKHADSSDRFIIVKVSGTVNGWLSQEEWNWISSHLY